MFLHYLQLGLASLRRNPLLTALMVMSIGVGVAASMVTYAVFRVVSSDPIPQKSSRLFVPQLDNRGPRYNRNGEPPDALTYTDAMALMQARRAPRQTMLYQVGLSVMPQQPGRLPFKALGYATFADFFPMFEVPFLYGRGWNADGDDARAPVVVIGRQLNQRLFGGADSVGRTVVMDDQAYRVAGVIDDWNPQPRFFDMFSSNGYADPPQIFVPFNFAVAAGIETYGNNSCGSGGKRGSDRESWLRGECVWVSPWVELDDAAQVQGYRSFLEGYARRLREAGRFGWAPNVRLRDVRQWLDYRGAVPPESRIALAVAIGFFIICLVNTIGLLLAKFLRRAPEIGVRRALGASRRHIYLQFLAEAGMVGLAGGALGVLLTGVGMFGIGLVFQPQIACLAHLDLRLVALSLAVAIAATVLAAFYPTWRAAQVQPAWQLKSN
ncbi:ABC transporter permease [Frateuria sp. MAH-13]|uniref:ABC transporter permease n=1 Tax=Frateuria flava TaxID=2821489 RepID=A0ABS4DK77_9GAMM|nr:ABC transporter permease [Frateuria flava]MBP1473445.1 ABC transporter permease [Frateuria flava]